MDIKKLTQEVLLKNMTPEQQTAVLESVTASVKEAKAVQKQKIAENVDLVLQALKRIEADMLKRVNNSAQTVEDRVKSIKDGKDGKNGLDGKNGKDGKDGKAGADGRDGKDGINGIAGERGQDGVGVQNAHIDFDGSLIISLTNGQELNVGEVVPLDVAEKIRVIGNGGGTSQYVLDTLADLQTQIDNIDGGGGTSGLTYKGTWNASTNTPTLTSSTGTNGWYYVVSAAGSTNLNGVTDWQIGDWAIYNGSAWQKIDQTNLVTSVNGNTGAVVLTASSVGALDTITSTDGSITVSGTGTTRNLSVTHSPNVVVEVRNSTGATLTKGTVVYITGATGQLPTVSKAIATGDATSAQTLGVMSANLANNSNGYVTIIGLVTDVDTSAYTDGAQLYLSPTTAGTYTTTKPYAPDHLVYVGIVEHAHPTQGKLFVKVQNGYELDELHNVSAQSPATGQTIVWNGSTNLWEKSFAPVISGTTINNTTIGATTASTGAFTTLSASGTTTLSGNQIISVTDNTNAALRITQLGTGHALLVEDSTNPDTTPFVVNANGEVLVGTTTGYYDTSGSIVVNSTSGGKLNLSRNDTTVVANDSLGLINFTGNDSSTGLQKTFAYIQALATGTHGSVDNPTELSFGTTPTGSETAVERMVIDAAGNVGIGTGTPSYKVDIQNAGDTTLRVKSLGTGTDDDAQVIIDAYGTGGEPGVYLQQDGSNVSLFENISGDLRVSNEVAAGSLIFRTVSTERMRIDSSGNVGIGTGTPTQELHLYKDQNSSTILLVDNPNAGTAASACFQLGPENGAANFVANSSTSTAAAITGGADGAGLYTSAALTGGLSVGTSAGPLKFFAGSTSVERARIESTGITLASTTGLSIGRTAVTGTPASTDGNVFSGTYTPTLTNTTNVASSTASGCQYMRVGNVVTVSGQVQVTPTATGNTVLGISLPIASDFTGAQQLGGTAMAQTTTQGATLYGDATNNRVLFRFQAAATTALTYAFSFTYQVV